MSQLSTIFWILNSVNLAPEPSLPQNTNAQNVLACLDTQVTTNLGVMLCIPSVQSYGLQVETAIVNVLSRMGLRSDSQTWKFMRLAASKSNATSQDQHMTQTGPCNVD